MSMKYCCDCGYIFDDEDESSYYTEVCRPTHRDRKFSYLTCPECKNDSSFENATKCEICGEWFYNEKRSRICDECLPKFYNSEILYEATRPSQTKTNIEIDSFLSEYFSEYEIEIVLLQELKKLQEASKSKMFPNDTDRKNCERIIKDNEYEYDEILAEYWRKNNGKV